MSGSVTSDAAKSRMMNSPLVTGSATGALAVTVFAPASSDTSSANQTYASGQRLYNNTLTLAGDDSRKRYPS